VNGFLVGGKKRSLNRALRAVFANNPGRFRGLLLRKGGSIHPYGTLRPARITRETLGEGRGMIQREPRCLSRFRIDIKGQ